MSPRFDRLVTLINSRELFAYLHAICPLVPSAAGPMLPVLRASLDSVLAGELAVTLGLEVRRLGVGEFVVVPAGTVHTFATVGDVPTSVLVTMTPNIDDLVRELHQVPEEERPLVWARYYSRLV